MKTATCVTCRQEFQRGDDEHWKKQCYNCYKNFAMFNPKYGKPTRIIRLRHKSDIYLAHPSVTKEEVDEFIAATGKERGWGAVEYDPSNRQAKIFINSTNYD